MTECLVAASLLVYPEDCIPVAWSLCRSDDFMEPRAQVAYDALAHAWAVKEQQEWPDGLASEVVAITAALRFRCDMPEAFGVVDYLAMAPPCDHPDHVGRRAACFEAHCTELAAEGAVRRVRGLLGEWHSRVSDVAVQMPSSVGPGPFRISNAERLIPHARTYKDALSARQALAGLLRDIRNTLRRTPHEARQTSAVPKVGEW